MIRQFSNPIAAEMYAKAQRYRRETPPPPKKLRRGQLTCLAFAVVGLAAAYPSIARGIDNLGIQAEALLKCHPIVQVLGGDDDGMHRRADRCE